MSTLSIFTRSRGLAPADSRVPWATVTTLGVGMSSTCAFWLVSLQGAIGATERTETPFSTWLMLSIALGPVFCAFVLGALTLAMRWFGPVLPGPRAMLTTALLLVAGGTLVGLAAIAASSAYDFHLQLRHIGGGVHAMAPCTGDCVPREQHAIFVLHVRGALLVGRWLLLSNAVLVGWLVAAWGGHIRLTGRATSGATGSGRGPGRRAFGDDVRLLLVGALTAAAVIHAAMVSGLREGPVAAAFLLVLAGAEIGIACLLLRPRPGGLALLGAAAVSVVALVMWLWSRTLALPFGPEPGRAEPIGVPDLLACALEVGILLAVLALLHPGRLARPALSPHARAVAGLVLVAVAVIGCAATGSGWFDAFGVGASHSTTQIHPESGADRLAAGGERS